MKTPYEIINSCSVFGTMHSIENVCCKQSAHWSVIVVLQQIHTCLPDRPSQGSSQKVNISHRVTPNIHTSERWEKDPTRKLSGAHLDADEMDTTLGQKNINQRNPI